MLAPHFRKFSVFYENYGLGAVKNIWLLTCLLPLARTVNLHKLKDYVASALGGTSTKPESNYRRLTRFFEDWGGNGRFLDDLMVHNLRFLKRRGLKVLVLDGTSWKIGSAKIHFLVLSVLVGTVAVPIYWVQLGKIGASSQEERKAMFDGAFKLFNLSGTTLLADREYVGQEWFRFLVGSGLNFVIRLRWGDYYEVVDLAMGNSYVQMADKCVKKKKLVKKQIVLLGVAYTIIMMPNPKPGAEEPVMIFLTTLPVAPKAAAQYAKRWKIECLFKHMKTNGFNLEDLNLKDAGKNLLMLGIVATAYILAIGEGLMRQKVIQVKRYKDGSEAMAASLFRTGLAILTAKCSRLIDFLQYVSETLNAKNHGLCKNVQ